MYLCGLDYLYIMIGIIDLLHNCLIRTLIPQIIKIVTDKIIIIIIISVFCVQFLILFEL